MNSQERSDGQLPTMGVEEEHFLVHPDTRALVSAGAKVVARASPELGDLVSGEFTRYQVEVKTPPCATTAQLRDELTRVRKGACEAAQQEGLRLCASGTPVIRGSGPVDIGDHPRYRVGTDRYRTMMEDFAISALHVHVYLPDRELAVLVGNHLRPWLPLLVAMSANSPFHGGRDTEYESWRSVIRSPFPCLGPPPYAESLDHYQHLAETMHEYGAMPVAELPFWDIRTHPRLPTLEVRSMDVPAHVEDSAALAALVRALVVTTARLARSGDPGPRPCSELLRAAYWRAARDGWSGSGVDALTGQMLPAPVQAGRLVAYIRPALEEHGDTDTVMAFLRRLETLGSGAHRQRASAQRGGLTAVVDDLIGVTAGDSPGMPLPRAT